jgi:hypothetical protein
VIFKTAALNHSATLPSQYNQALTSVAERTKCEICHPIATLTIQGCIDRRRSLAVVLFEEVRVDPQCDVRFAVAKALADGDDIHASVD